MKKLLTFLIILIFIPIVLSQGICTLDKDFYHPGETATLSCECDSAQEENRNGFIVFQNESDILQSVSISSSACRTSFFGDGYTFEIGADYKGNATFSANADGSGVPANWGNVGDNISDDFNVSGPHIVDCEIINLESMGNFSLGELGSVEFDVIDATTLNPLVHASCIIEGEDINDKIIMIEPYGAGDTSRVASAGGHISFQHMLDEAAWETNTTYLFDIRCHCIPNSTHGDECWDDTTGSKVAFKSCTRNELFRTGLEDNRTNDMRYSIASILVIIGLIFIFVALAFLFHKKGTTKETEGDISGSKDLIKDANWFKVMELFTILFILFLTILLNNAGKLIAADSGATTPILNMFDTLHISLIAVTVLFLTLMMMRFFVLLIENFKREKLEEEMGIRNKK